MESIHHLHSLPETDEFNTLGIPVNLAETRATIEPWIAANKTKKPSNFTFAIHNSDLEFMGLFGLKLSHEKARRAEVWYKINSKYWGKGIATEVLIKMIDVGFNELNLHRIEAGCAVDNIASIKVLEKAGMIREGRGRQILPLKSGWSDNFVYSILETDRR